MKTHRILAIVVLLPAFLFTSGPRQDQGMSGEELRRELRDNASGFWIYDDLEAAEAESLRSKKPLLLSLRCVP